MIGLKARGTDGHSWRIVIKEEEWEFNSTKDMQRVLDILIKLKDKEGRIDKRIQP